MEQNEGLVSGEQSHYTGAEHAGDPRAANVPPCRWGCIRPVFYHNLNEMPTQSSRRVVKKALLGWIGLLFVIFWNFIAMSALAFTPVDTKKSDGGDETTTSGFTTSWIIALLLLLLLTPVAFSIYMCLYTAARKTSSLYYCCFFPLAGGLVIFCFLAAIGVPNTGGGGLLNLIVASGAGYAQVPAIFLGISMAFWLLATAYGVYLILKVRVEYAGAGGLEAAKKEGTRAAAKTAYDHREEIKDVAWEHRDEIKQAAVDNKDLLIDVARENQDVVREMARDDPDFAWQAAVAAAQANDAPRAPTKATGDGGASGGSNPFASASGGGGDDDENIDWGTF